MTQHTQHVRMECSVRQRRLVDGVAMTMVVVLAVLVVIAVIHFALMWVQIQDGMQEVRDAARANQVTMDQARAHQMGLASLQVEPTWSAESTTAAGYRIFCEFGPGRMSISSGPVGVAAGPTRRGSGGFADPAKYREWFNWADRRNVRESAALPGTVKPIDRM